MIRIIIKTLFVAFLGFLAGFEPFRQGFRIMAHSKLQLQRHSEVPGITKGSFGFEALDAQSLFRFWLQVLRQFAWARSMIGFARWYLRSFY